MYSLGKPFFYIQIQRKWNISTKNINKSYFRAIRYEDLALNPYAMLKTLFQEFLEIPWTDEVQNFIQSHTTAEEDKSNFWRGLEGFWGQPQGSNFTSPWATILALRLDCANTAALATPQKVSSNWELVKLKMLDFSHCTQTSISILTSAADPKVIIISSKRTKTTVQDSGLCQEGIIRSWSITKVKNLALIHFSFGWYLLRGWMSFAACQDEACMTDIQFDWRRLVVIPTSASENSVLFSSSDIWH